MKHKTTEILGHDVNWHLSGYEQRLEEIPGDCEDHIRDSIEQGYSCGELHSENKKGNIVSGWWDIPNWRDIACELREQLMSLKAYPKDKQLKIRIKETLKKFDENWVS